MLLSCITGIAPHNPVERIVHTVALSASPCAGKSAGRKCTVAPRMCPARALSSLYCSWLAARLFRVGGGGEGVDVGGGRAAQGEDWAWEGAGMATETVPRSSRALRGPPWFCAHSKAGADLSRTIRATAGQHRIREPRGDLQLLPWPQRTERCSSGHSASFRWASCFLSRWLSG